LTKFVSNNKGRLDRISLQYASCVAYKQQDTSLRVGFILHLFASRRCRRRRRPLILGLALAVLLPGRPPHRVGVCRESFAAKKQHHGTRQPSAVLVCRPPGKTSPQKVPRCDTEAGCMVAAPATPAAARGAEACPWKGRDIDALVVDQLSGRSTSFQRLPSAHRARCA
jgi:hypothetical protein